MPTVNVKDIRFIVTQHKSPFGKTKREKGWGVGDYWMLIKLPTFLNPVTKRQIVFFLACSR